MSKHDSYFDDDIDLKELFSVILDSKKLIIQITLIFAVVSVATSLSLTNYYKSEALLISRSNSENPLSQYSGLAAMAGVQIGSSTQDKTAQIIELVKSRSFVQHLLTFENILPSIMAPKSYDTETKELTFDRKLYDSETKSWKRKLGRNKSVIPSYIEVHEEYINNIMTVSQDSTNNFISLHVEHISPVFAKEFLDLVIREANELMRKKDMEDSRQGLEYLKSELSKTSFVEIQESINTLIEAQLETQMMTQINQDYILIEIDPPFIAEEKSKPSRALISIFGTILGAILSVSFVLINHYLLPQDKQI